MKHRLAGNLSIWPNARLLRPGWIEFAVEENSNGVVAQHTALASVFVLRGGLGNTLADFGSAPISPLCWRLRVCLKLRQLLFSLDVVRHNLSQYEQAG